MVKDRDSVRQSYDLWSSVLNRLTFSFQLSNRKLRIWSALRWPESCVIGLPRCMLVYGFLRATVSIAKPEPDFCVLPASRRGWRACLPRALRLPSLHRPCASHRYSEAFSLATHTSHAARAHLSRDAVADIDRRPAGTTARANELRAWDSMVVFQMYYGVVSKPVRCMQS